MKNLVEKATEWVKKATDTRRKLKDEAYDIAEQIIRQYGKEDGENIVIDLTENGDTITVMEHDDYDGGWVARSIEKIELSKKYGGIVLVYGEEDYEYINFSETLLSDRVFIIDELLSIFS